MIISFRSKALKKFWWKDDPSKLPAQQIVKIRILLTDLESAEEPEDMDVQGYYFHSLSGTSKGRYSVRVAANYRITFSFEDENTIQVDYEDYH